ncbi:MAG: choline dehydrogenase [Gaiellales bacterium]|nr:choline dehydrogenase [Gaiellales bacterium]
MTSERWDAIVCGGGTAGPVVVARLVAAGRRVLLLEAGPDYGSFDGGAWPPELVDSTTIPSTHDWGYVSGDELPGRALPYERARVIGGCSAHNGCTVSWGHRADFDDWALPGWSADELLPLFGEASRRMRVRRFSDEELSPFHRAFIQAGAGLGLPEADDLDTLDGVAGVSAEPSNSPGGVRWNAAFAYLDPVRSSPLLEIRDRTIVDRVLVEAGRAAGVRATGREGAFEARADQVVLTAGAYGTPALLLRSGVGPADELGALGIEVMADNPGVGANLHDHPSFELIFERTDELDRRDAAFVASGHVVPDEQGFAKVASSRCRGAPFDLHLFSELLAEGRPGIFVACLTPRSRGRVTLTSADPESPPRIDHGLLSDPEGHDLAVLVEGAALAGEFAARPELAGLLGPQLEPAADLAAAIRTAVIHCWHPVGSCAMGIACDERGRVHGVEGLVVADASLFPQTVRATTNLPTVVVAERVGGWLAQ